MTWQTKTNNVHPSSNECKHSIKNYEKNCQPDVDIHFIDIKTFFNCQWIKINKQKTNYNQNDLKSILLFF